MLCGYQNQPCVSLGYQSGYLLSYLMWKNPKPQFWHFESWFLKVLKIFKNMFLYIIVGSFGSGGEGEGKVFIFIFDAVEEGCDPTIIPTLQTAAMLCEDGLYIKTMMVQPRHRLTPIVRCFIDRSLPHPPKPRQTDGCSELIYKIV